MPGVLRNAELNVRDEGTNRLIVAIASTFARLMQAVGADVLVTVGLIAVVVHSDEALVVLVGLAVYVRATGCVPRVLDGVDRLAVVLRVDVVRAAASPLPQLCTTSIHTSNR